MAKEKVGAALVPVIRVIKEKCINCHRCIAACPVKMCNDGSGDVIDFHPSLCIGCGACIHVCEQGARIGIDDFDAFLKDLKAGTNIIVVVAPAVVASFGDSYLKLNAFIKKLGVKAVFDVSFGAELTIKSYYAYKKKHNPPLMIASPCPSLVSFVELYHPELIKYLAPTDTPMGHIMKAIRRFYPQYAQCKIAAFSPCYAKRHEFNAVGIGDYNVTFRSIQQYLKENNERLERYSEQAYDSPLVERAVLFPVPGGLMQTLARYDKSAISFTRRIEGVPEVYHYLADFNSFLDKHKPSCNLIDCLSCKLGCNGGPGTLIHNHYIEEIALNTEKRAHEVQAHYKKSVPFNKLERILDSYWADGFYTRSFTDRSSLLRTILRTPTQGELADTYKRLHKIKPSDFLNCGACGYKDCEQMATAIINGLNRPEHCWHYVMMQNKLNEERYQQELKRAIDKIYERTLQETNSNISDINALLSRITEAVSSINSSSTTIEAMVVSIRSINENVKHNADMVIRLNTSSLEGKKQLLKIGELVGKISEESAALVSISKIIESVSEETKILGMNASIEAAHAGEVGKGFAVVAGEIRHLAETAGAQSKEIEHSLSSIKGLIDSSVASSGSAQNQFDTIIKLVNAVKNEEQIIASAVESESNNGKQVIDALASINELITMIKNETARLLSSSKSILENMSSLRNV